MIKPEGLARAEGGKGDAESSAVTARYLHPLDAALSDLGARPSGLEFPPIGWRMIKQWGVGYALQDSTGLRVIIDCERKADERFWVHVSVSRERHVPSHGDMVRVKEVFLGIARYAYAVYPPRSEYVNIHPNCLHLWALAEGNGQALPEFSAILDGIGKSI